MYKIGQIIRCVKSSDIGGTCVGCSGRVFGVTPFAEEEYALDIDQLSPAKGTCDSADVCVAFIEEEAFWVPVSGIFQHKLGAFYD